MSLGSIDLSELMNDPDFARAFTIRRQTPSQVDGETVTSSVDSSAMGALQPASASELQMLPEGDRHGQIIVVCSTTEMKMEPGQADILKIGGDLFRVIKLEQRQGYWKAFARGYQP